MTGGIDRLRNAGRGETALRWDGPPGPGPTGRVLTALSVSTGDPDPRLDAVPRAGESVELIATVRTYGTRPSGAVAFFIDDRFVGRTPLPATESETLAPTEIQVRFPAKFEATGTARLEARLEGEPGPEALARRYAAIPVRGPLRVLIVADRSLSNDGPAGDPGFFLKQALAADADTFRVTSSAFEAVSPLDLKEYDAVACLGAPPADVAGFLRTYLEAGGGLFVALRPADAPADLRALFAGPLGGIDIGPVRGVIDPTEPEATGFTFEFAPNEPGFAHLRPVSGPRGGLVVGFRQLNLAENRPPGSWSVRSAARFAEEAGADAGPAVLTAAGPNGGRAAVLATSVDATWGGPWPAAGASFVPLVRGLIAFVALPTPAEAAETGDALIEPIPPDRFVRAMRIVRPDGAARLAPVAENAVRFTETDVPGFYRIGSDDPGDGAGRLIAVNGPPSEADPRTAPLPDIDAPRTKKPTAVAPSRPLSAWVWAAALGALLIEPALGRGRRS
ncbi:hypothetical protein LzC2_41510 [Planctomycetes bacterium LzC2]|uniref:Uncharacterized protein n=1 Tax=Alienimonas chondri TaxID=2681879 RepID=A0ABX1VKZ0_9PLAN|nr:hypothetical protein [Alienimonas chondri]